MTMMMMMMMTVFCTPSAMGTMYAIITVLRTASEIATGLIFSPI
jgi:hypothetical protein